MEFMYKYQRREQKKISISETMGCINSYGIKTIQQAWELYTNVNPLSEERERLWNCYVLIRDRIWVH